LQIGQERQPAIIAARAALSASEIGHLSLYGLKRIAERFTPDLDVRRQQSQRGIAASVAEVLKAQQENTYDVTRLYYEYIYATQQEQTAADIVEQMETFYKSAVRILELEVPDPNVKINEFTLGTLDGIIGEVRDLRDQASVGRRKALAALREAMGVEQEFAFVPADQELPLMGGIVTEELVVSQALARRPELVQAAVVVDVSRLEVCAQAKQTRQQKSPTFASGTDLHARVLPAPVRNGEYRPGAVPPQMPTQLVGNVNDRVARATELAKHQEAAYAKAVGLVKLESINAFLNWESAVERVKDAKARHERLQKLVEKSRAAAATRMDPELLIRNESLASQAQAKYVKAVHDLILAMVALEKVTAGGVYPAFPGR
jgi:outer membrane protein TolC